MKMPFGKYQDLKLADVPQPYLLWLRDQKWVGAWLVKAIDETLDGGPAGGPEATEEGIVDPWEDSPKPCRAFSVVRFGNVGRDIVDREGKLIAWALDEGTAQVICGLLNENEELLARKDQQRAMAACG
jgi:uncharacterized iron-regulated protein